MYVALRTMKSTHKCVSMFSHKNIGTVNNHIFAIMHLFFFLSLIILNHFMHDEHSDPGTPQLHNLLA